MNLSPEKKIAGILAPLFALRGENDLGIGDTGALREFIDWAAGIGFKLVQLLPINEIGADNSPYNAISAIAIEPTTLHLEPGSPQDLTRQDFDASLSEAAVSRLRGGAVKYRQVKELKQSLLETEFENSNGGMDSCMTDLVAHLLNQTTKTKRSIENVVRTVGSRSIGGRECARTIFNGGASGCAASAASFISFGSTTSRAFTASTPFRGGRN